MRTGVARSSAFVLALTQRYARYLVRGGPLALTLWHPRMPVPRRVHSSTTVITVAPRIGLKLFTVRPRTTRAHAARSSVPSLIYRTEGLVEHCSGRGRRVYLDAGVYGSTGAQSRAAAPTSALTPADIPLVRHPASRSSVPMVVRRAVTAPPAEPAPSPDQGTSAPVQYPKGASPQQAFAGPPLNLGRLTDEVVQAIDRRIVAERERLGRV